jgi:hypothetical protein
MYDALLMRPTFAVFLVENIFEFKMVITQRAVKAEIQILREK